LLYPGRCPGLRASALSGRAAYRNFLPLPLPYPSASDFQFPSAGDRWLRAYWVFSTVQVEKKSRIMQKSLWGENKMCKFASLNGWLHKFYNF
ncbi:MAG: hypothetical protein UFD09_13250, partial [Prevotella sp.]|nr:hypothetical protein [Prevotella sp.]